MPLFKPVEAKEIDLESQGPEGKEEKGQLQGRTAVPLSADENTNQGGGISCCGIGSLLLIAGGIMYAVSKRACDDPTRGCNLDVKDAGEYMMIVGGSMVGLSCCCIGTIVCAYGVFAKSSN